MPNPWTSLPPIRPNTARRAEILAKYARVRNGVPVRCTPSRETEVRRAESGLAELQAKVIFRDLRSAQEASRELYRAGMRPTLYAYVCPLSESGHAHLTKRRPK